MRWIFFFARSQAQSLLFSQSQTHCFAVTSAITVAACHLPPLPPLLLPPPCCCHAPPPLLLLPPPPCHLPAAATSLPPAAPPPLLLPLMLPPPCCNKAHGVDGSVQRGWKLKLSNGLKSRVWVWVWVCGCVGVWVCVCVCATRRMALKNLPNGGGSSS